MALTFTSPQTDSVYTLADGQSESAHAFVCYRVLSDGRYRIRIQCSSVELRDAIKEHLPGMWGTGLSGGNDHLSAIALSSEGLVRVIADAREAINQVLADWHSDECNNCYN